jgi:hypothetical protein
MTVETFDVTVGIRSRDGLKTSQTYGRAHGPSYFRARVRQVEAL